MNDSSFEEYAQSVADVCTTVAWLQQRIGALEVSFAAPPAFDDAARVHARVRGAMCAGAPMRPARARPGRPSSGDR